MWQSLANTAFAFVTGSMQLQLYFLDAFVIGIFIIMGFATTSGLRREGAHRHYHQMKAQVKA